jgi:hypothetical protein
VLKLLQIGIFELVRVALVFGFRVRRPEVPGGEVSLLTCKEVRGDLGTRYRSSSLASACQESLGTPASVRKR